MGDLIPIGNLETELQKMYDSEIHVHIGWLWDGGINLSIGSGEITEDVRTVAEVLPWLQKAIEEHYPESKYNAERMGGRWEPTWVEPPEEKTKTQRLTIVHRAEHEKQ